MSIRRSSKKRGGTLSVAVIVVAFLIVMIFQIVQLKNKETAYAQQTAELNKQLKDLKAELFNLRFQHAINQLDNPIRIEAVKKDIARVMTVLAEKNAKNA